MGKAERDEESTDEIFFADHLWSMYPKMKKFLYTLTMDKDLTDDLVQNTFLNCWRKIEAMKGYRNLRSAIYAIAQNEYRQWRRSHREEEASSVLVEPYRLRWVKGTSNIDDFVRKNSDVHSLKLLFKGVNEESIQVVLLVDYYGYSLKEVAKLLDRNYNTVVSQRQRALEEMRKRKENLSSSEGGLNEKKERG